LALWLCDTAFRVSGIYAQNPNLYFLPIYYSLGFGPLIYFYTKQLTQGKGLGNYRDALHFVPVFLQFLFYLYLQTRSYGYKRDFWLEIHRPYTYDLELILSFASLLIYLGVSRRLIGDYKRKIDNSLSNIHRIALQWLNRLHLVLAFLAFLWLLEAVGRLIWNYYPLTPFSSITIGVTILLIAIGGILQKDLQPIRASLKEQQPEEDPSEKEAPASLDPQGVALIRATMAEQALFLNQELTLKEFAGQVGMSPRETSRLINAGLQMTFIDFVNQYRVNRFKELVKNNQLNHLSLLGLAFESGFNSKSTFNRVFKKMEGTSPSAFVKEAKTSQNT
jgi:AraC-like DNA-binding protein